VVESALIITDKSPIGKNSALEAVRIGSGFVALGEYIECKVIFNGDAVYLLTKNAMPQSIGMDSFDEVFEMADLSDLELCVLDSALIDAGISKEDLIEYENLKVITIDDLVDLIDNVDVCFRF
jgi:sulfur relay (sulfurtransferase) DsrF/TusC family protein